MRGKEGRSEKALTHFSALKRDRKPISPSKTFPATFARVSSLLKCDPTQEGGRGKETLLFSPIPFSRLPPFPITQRRQKRKGEGRKEGSPFHSRRRRRRSVPPPLPPAAAAAVPFSSKDAFPLPSSFPDSSPPLSLPPPFPPRFQAIPVRSKPKGAAYGRRRYGNHQKYITVDSW